MRGITVPAARSQHVQVVPHTEDAVVDCVHAEWVVELKGQHRYLFVFLQALLSRTVNTPSRELVRPVHVQVIGADLTEVRGPWLEFVRHSLPTKRAGVETWFGVADMIDNLTGIARSTAYSFAVASFPLVHLVGAGVAVRTVAT